MPERRILDFSSMDEIMPDVERLLGGHSAIAQWTLAQILYHLATAIRLTRRERGDTPPRPGSEVFRQRFFRSRRFPEGLTAPHPMLIPPVDADAQVQAQALREAIARFASTTGPFPDHPLLGTLNKEEWTQFHCIHCAHHLSFAIPLPAESGSTIATDPSESGGSCPAREFATLPTEARSQADQVLDGKKDGDVPNHPEDHLREIAGHLQVVSTRFQFTNPAPQRDDRARRQQKDDREEDQ